MQNSERISETTANSGKTIPFRSKILQSLWDELAACPKLADVAHIQRGVQYPFLRNNQEIFSHEPDEGFALGLSRVDDEIEPYIAKPSRYLNMDPKVLRGKDLQKPWLQPKVIANAVSTNVQRWPLIGAIDEQGLVFTQDFYGIWPTGSLPIEVLAALINSPIVNAFLSTHALSEHNHQAILQQAPIPNLTKADIHLITSLVRNYRATREQWHKEPAGDTGRGILRRIESVMLGYYNLSLQTERDVVSYFEGYRRPGSIELTQVNPSHQNRLCSTIVEIEDIRHEGDDDIVDAIVVSWNPHQTIHFSLSLIPKEIRDKISQNTLLLAKVNVGAGNEKDLVFEDIKLPPEPKRRW
jgi:hypothetical protein